MDKLILYLQRNPRTTKIFTIGYTTFAGCTIFPFGNQDFPFDFMKAYVVIFSYAFIGLGFAGINNTNKEKFVYKTSLTLTGIGMICRYFIEYGEVSNIMNFTLFNIISYLIIIPVYIVIVYHFILKYLEGKKQF